MRSNAWEIEEAQAALRAGELDLVERYLEKALEAVRCVYCHGSLTDGRPHQPHFKGFVHDECLRDRRAGMTGRAFTRTNKGKDEHA